ncbi:MAG: pyridoxal-phosphate dependent enzyme [Myxococcota bacterium]|nr:pyridoxal-phosphate dependent enzyme [Myxococcota bacterium]
MAPAPPSFAPTTPPPLLGRRFPALAGRLPWLSLGSFPTPVQRVSGLGFELWLKRDDLAGSPGLPGGNKVRKLEPVLAGLLQQGAGTLVTSGAQGSSHLLAAASYARRCGLRACLVVGPQHPGAFVAARYALLQQSGARLVPVPRLELTAPVALLRSALPGAALVEPGASGPRGVLGHLVAGLELAAQIAAGELPCPEAVWVAAGSGGTAVGLALGLGLAGLGGVRVVGVRVVPRPWLTQALLDLEGRAARRLLARLAGEPAVDRLLRGSRPTLLDGQLGAGYGVPTLAAEAARHLLARSSGVLLDPTYTGKAFAALLAARDAGRLRGPQLFWDTFDPGRLPAEVVLAG